MPTETRIEHRYPAALVFMQQHGPDAVAIVHDLLAHAERRGNRLVVEASVRQVADRLAFLSKDTVHRRLRQLLRAGIIRRLPSKPATTFARPVYILDLAGTGISLSSRSGRHSA
jgi:SOS-response transcriptional repressor LexA